MIFIMLSGFGINNFFRDFLKFTALLWVHKSIFIKALLFALSTAVMSKIIYDNAAVLDEILIFDY